MKTELTPENLADFRERFGTFHDSVIHSVEYGIFSHNLPETVTVIVGTGAWAKPSPNWINIIFYIEGIKELSLNKAENYAHGIVFRLNIAFFDQKVYLDFFPFTDNPTSPQDFREGSFGSMLLIIGERCYWSEEPYQVREK